MPRRSRRNAVEFEHNPSGYILRHGREVTHFACRSPMPSRFLWRLQWPTWFVSMLVPRGCLATSHQLSRGLGGARRSMAPGADLGSNPGPEGGGHRFRRVLPGVCRDLAPVRCCRHRRLPVQDGDRPRLSRFCRAARPCAPVGEPLDVATLASPAATARRDAVGPPGDRSPHSGRAPHHRAPPQPVGGVRRRRGLRAQWRGQHRGDRLRRACPGIDG